MTGVEEKKKPTTKKTAFTNNACESLDLNNNTINDLL